MRPARDMLTSDGDADQDARARSRVRGVCGFLCRIVGWCAPTRGAALLSSEHAPPYVALKDHVAADATKDHWRAAYALAFGTDPMTGDPLEQALFRRMGVSWRSLWTMRQRLVLTALPIDERVAGALFQGERHAHDGQWARGQFCLCIRRSRYLGKTTPLWIRPFVTCPFCVPKANPTHAGSIRRDGRGRYPLWVRSLPPLFTIHFPIPI